ncbi:MAG TPA: hypothetical protein DCY88_15770, partial [Cyanobacteria bacterium UBA11372]|nr:hypothetical protein [Cyanobacteria bacterium UBA11372]
ADFLEDSHEVKASAWFGRYLDGETVEFYIEGSGGYAISNIDLSSHEIYFTKQTVMANLEPIIFFCYQNEYAAAGEALGEGLQKTLEKLNKRSRVPITLEASQRPPDAPIRLNSTQMRKIRKSLLIIADTTPITSFAAKETTQLIPSPQVCIELGYALQCKRTEQILLAHMERPDMSGQFPFDLPNYQRLSFKTAAELDKILPKAIEAQLARYNLF